MYTLFREMTCTYTEGDIIRIREKISSNVSVDEDGCEIWNGYMIKSKIPSMHCKCENNVKRLISVSRFIWTQCNGIYDHRKHELVKSCQKDRCLSLDHFGLQAKNKSGDHDHVWNLILAKTTVDQNGCFISRSRDRNGYSLSILDGVTMLAHKAVFIVKNNGGSQNMTKMVSPL